MKKLSALSKESQQKLHNYLINLGTSTHIGFALGNTFSMEADINARQQITYRDGETTAFTESGFWNTDSLTPLEAAINLDDEALITELVGQGADIISGLNFAVISSKKRIVDLLVNLGGDKNTPAVKNFYERCEIVGLGSISQLSKESRLKLGGYFSVSNFIYNTIFDIGFEITDYIDGLPRSGYQFTPLHFAAYTNDIDLINELLNLGVKINRRDKEEGYTALEWAATYGCKAAVSLLLKRGATEGKENALKIAAAKVHASMLSFYSCSKKSEYKLIQNMLEANLAAEECSQYYAPQVSR